MSVISLVKVSDLLGLSSTLHLLFEVVNKQVLPKEKTDMHGVNLLLFSGGNRVTRRNYTCQQSVKTTKFIWLVEFWRQTVKLLRSRVWWDSKAMKMLTARPLCCHWGGGGESSHIAVPFFLKFNIHTIEEMLRTIQMKSWLHFFLLPLSTCIQTISTPKYTFFVSRIISCFHNKSLKFRVLHLYFLFPHSLTDSNYRNLKVHILYFENSMRSTAF